MYAIPHQSRESFRASLRRSVALGVDHISAYSLIIEPGTPIGDNIGDYADLLPDEDAELGMYEDAVSILADNGYEHYEISNYAHKGRECRHNMLYWSCDDYIGLGVSASSYFGGVRYKNTESIDEYISHAVAHPVAPCEQEGICPEEREREYIMLSLRTARGVREEDFRRRFGRGFYESYRERIDAVVAKDPRLLTVSPERVSLTDRGLYLSNAVINSII
jgi:oxygen-independent coproporphyrinogen-3 oxidase